MKDYSTFLLNTNVRIFTHIIFWGLVLVYYTFFFGHQGGYYLLTFKFVILLLPISISTTYFFNYFLIPKYLLNNKFFKFSLFSIYTLITSFWIISLISLPFLALIGPGMDMFDNSLIDLYFVIVGMYSVSILAILIKLLKYWYLKQNEHIQLLKEKSEAELEMLKGQINPHFLFNTLNNIYSLSLKKSDLTPEAVLKLSEMLDYLLYECKSDRVSLKNEVKLIQNYIYLQKIRFGDRLDIQFDNLANDDLNIAPMILLPFIENSFKHGVGNQSKEVWIVIHLSQTEKYLSFKVSNSKIHQDQKRQSSESGGIGLENVKKRLQLLYPEGYSLEIEPLPDRYSVILKIKTNAMALKQDVS